MEVSKEEIKKVEDQIRDLINIVKVRQEEEVEGATHKIEKEAADDLIAKLEELAKAVGSLGGETVIE